MSIPSKCITEITGELVSEAEKVNVTDSVKERLEVVMVNLWCRVGIHNLPFRSQQEN